MSYRRESLRVWRITAALSFLLALVFLISRFLPSCAQEPSARLPVAAGVTVSGLEPPQESPPAAPSRMEPRRNKTDPNPPSSTVLPVEKIQASGTGFCTAEYPSVRRKALARRAAEVIARRNLAEAVEAHIRGRTRVVQGAVVDDEILSTVDQIVKGARIIEERELAEGGYEVRLEISLGR